MLVCGRAFAATGEIEEIVVTAEKRASTVQSTAAAITAFSSDTIEQQHLYKPDQLQFSVPSMTYGMQSGYSFITLRGIGTDVTTLAAEPSVATYQDGVYTGALFTQDPLRLEPGTAREVAVTIGPRR